MPWETTRPVDNPSTPGEGQKPPVKDYGPVTSYYQPQQVKHDKSSDYWWNREYKAPADPVSNYADSFGITEQNMDKVFFGALGTIASTLPMTSPLFDLAALAEEGAGYLSGRFLNKPDKLLAQAQNRNFYNSINNQYLNRVPKLKQPGSSLTNPASKTQLDPMSRLALKRQQSSYNPGTRQSIPSTDRGSFGSPVSPKEYKVFDFKPNTALDRPTGNRFYRPTYDPEPWTLNKTNIYENTASNSLDASLGFKTPKGKGALTIPKL